MSSSKLPARKIEDRLIETLKPYPRQKEIFPGGSLAEDAALKADIQTNGLHNYIEITADGTLITGHRRLEAAKSLGWTTIPCWIRDDLERQGPGAVERRFIEDNLNRRQLSILGIARAYVALKAVATRDNSRALTDLEKHKIKGDLRDFFAKRFGLSGRTLDRYALLLTTPPPVQTACDTGKISQAETLAIAKAPKATQQQIAAALEAGKPFKGMLPKRDSTAGTTLPPYKVFARLRIWLKKTLDSELNLPKLAESHGYPNDVELLRRAATTFSAMSKAAQKGAERNESKRNSARASAIARIVSSAQAPKEIAPPDTLSGGDQV